MSHIRFLAVENPRRARPLAFGTSAGFCLAIAAVVLCVPRALPAQQTDGMAAAAAFEQALVETIRRTESSVVSVARIRATPPLDRLSVRDLDNEGRNDIGRPDSPEFVPNEFGAGIVVAPLLNSDQRFILTNYHVVRGAPAAAPSSKPGGEGQIYVRFGDRRGYYARIIAADPRSDLAVLSIEYVPLALKPADLRPIPLRTSREPLRKGQLVIGLGNPYAIARDGSASASWGMISNVARRPAPVRTRDPGMPRSETIHQFGTLLQVDTRMELGTSGGALVNLRGELVGITTSLAALDGYEKSVGFAIPIDDFSRRIIDALCRGYEVEYGFLGLSPQTVLPGELRRYGKFPQPSAVRVYQVIANSPAANAQMQPDDVILEIEGNPLLDQYDLMRYVGAFGPDATIRIKIWRAREGRELTLMAKLGKWPVVDDEAIVATAQRFPPWRGMTVDYPTARFKYFGWPQQFKDAVLVTGVAAKSAAQSAGLVEGDFVSGVAGTSVRTPSEFYQAVQPSNGDVTLDLADQRRVTVHK